MLAAPQTAKYDDPDYLIFEYEKDNSGTFEILGAFYGHDWVNGDATNGDMREDTDLDGAADFTGTILNSTFQTFSYSLDTGATNLVFRVRLKMNSGDEEIAFDNIRIYEYMPPVVTMNVDMNYQITLGNFDPLSDFVDIAGSMNGWSGTAMTDTVGDNIWTVDISGVNETDVLEYKFRINSSNWESVGNRFYTVLAGANVVDHLYNDEAPAVLTNVTFNVDMSYQSTLGAFNPSTDYVDVAGNFNGWDGIGYMLTDLDTDLIYTITIDSIAEAYVMEFKFRINGDWNNSEFPGGSNRFYTVLSGGTNVVDYWYTDEMPPPPATPTGVFFSEYIEGSSNNKALEIYNGSNDIVNLDDFAIAQASNGNGWSYYHNFPVGATIAVGDVWVLINSSTDTTLFDYAEADEILSYPSAVHHNGDDARALCFMNGVDTIIVDLIGDPDNDPGSGWDVAGVSSATANHTLVRDASIVDGNTDWVAASVSEWIVLDENTFTWLGSHPNTLTSQESFTINVDMNYQITLGNFIPFVDTVFTLGSFNGWTATELTDIDSDGVYSVVIADLYVDTLYEYKFRINSSNWETIANRQYTIISGTNEVTHMFNDEAAPLYTNVAFVLNMSYWQTLGNFDPSVDFVDVAGNFNGWDGTAYMLSDPDSDLIYTITIDSMVIGSQMEWKFRINGSWSDLTLEFPFGGPNRTYTVVAGANVMNYWYNDDMPIQYDNIFFSEYIEGSSNNKAIEVYNGSGAAVDLSEYAILTNYNGSAWSGQYDFPAGTILADGDVWVIANSSSDSVILSVTDDTLAYNASGYIVGFNGDDVRALVKIFTTDTVIIDIIGRYDFVDPGSGWEVAGVANGTQDHTLIRKSSILTGNSDWDAAAGTDAASSEWIVFDQNTYTYVGSHPHIVATQEDLTVNVDMSYQISSGNFVPGVDTINVAGSFEGWSGTEMIDLFGDSIYMVVFADLYVDSLYEYKFRINSGNWETINNRQYTMVTGTNVVDHWFNDEEPAELISVTFNVNMNYQQVLGIFDSSIDFVDVAGNFNGWDGTGFQLLDPDTDLIYSITIDSISVGFLMEFKFRINGSWSDLTLEFPFGGPNRNYTVVAGTNEMDYWYNDEQAALYDNIFFSEYIEGSSNNKAIEIYNGSGSIVDLSEYAILTNYNGNAWSFDHYDFPAGTILADGDVWVIANNSSDSVILSVTDDTLAYNASGYIVGFNGDDVRALAKITATDTLIIDIIGRYDLVDPGSGWEVAGISNGTQDHTLVRKFSVANGNSDWDAAAGTNTSDSEWKVFDQNTFEYLGSHVDIDTASNYDITFTVTDGTESYTDIELKGEFTNWALIQMFDDGTNGDIAAGDFVWTCVINVAPGSYEWGAIENDGSTWGLWLIEGSNITFTLDSSGIVTGDVDYVIPPPGGESVTFNVNMNYQMTLGNFDLINDFVDLAGNFNGWGGSLPLDDSDGDGIYTITIDSLNVGYVCQYKFRINGTGWESFADDRTYEVQTGSNILDHWFNDEEPPIVADLLFSEYVEGSSNNKALEIYNGSGASADLANYRIANSHNADGWTSWHYFPAGATLADGDVWVIVADQISATYFDTTLANEVIPYSGSSPVHFNGDDARALEKTSDGGATWTIIDAFGDETLDPGDAWPVAGEANATQNNTLVRKTTVLNGNTDWVASFGTNYNDSEWFVFDENTFEHLGSHNPIEFDTIAAVTFNVNMTYQESIGNFDFVNDVLDVPGTLNGWSASDFLTDTDGDGIYTITFDSMTVGEMLEFKFRINTDWALAEFPGGANRQYTVVDGVNILDVWFNDEEPLIITSIYDIQFTSDPSGDSPLDGQNVTTAGFVTGISSYGYFIQDATGAWNGIYVYDSNNPVAIGDSVVISGEVDEYYGFTEIKNVSSFTIVTSGNMLPETEPVAVGNFTEEYESVLVLLENVVCTNDNMGYGEWEITDGLDTGIVNDLMYVYTPVLGSTYNVRGIIDYSFSAFKLEPTDSTDIEEVTTTIDFQTINFGAGWNLFSTYIIPDEPNIDSVLNSIAFDIVIAKDENGAVYWPLFGINAIGNMIIGEGFLVKLNNAQSLDIYGTAAIPELTPISLDLGWSYLGYLRQTEADISIMLSDINANLTIAKNGIGQIYWPIYGINSIGNMVPGQAYQVKLDAASVLTYPANSSKSSIENSLTNPKHFKTNINTGNNMSLCIPLSSWDVRPETGDEIGVFNSNGNLLGSAVFNNQNTALSIWGDDNTTNATEGFLSGEIFDIKVWSQKTGNIESIIVTDWIEGSHNFETDAISVVASLKAISDNAVLNQNSPNPFSTTTQISFYLPESSFVNISIYNSLGELIETTTQTTYSNGEHSIDFVAKNLPAGTYFYKISANDFEAVKQMNIIK